MEEQLETKVLVVFEVVRVLLLPVAWLESICLSVLGFSTSTPFRMFPTHDTHAWYPACIPNTYALVMTLLIPFLVYADAKPGALLPLGMLLRPLTRRCSRSVCWILMFPRVWLYMALFNWHVLEIFNHPNLWLATCFKISSSVFIL